MSCTSSRVQSFYQPATMADDSEVQQVKSQQVPADTYQKFRMENRREENRRFILSNRGFIYIPRPRNDIGLDA